MTRAQQRAVALGSARYYLRQMQVNPLEVSAQEAHAALDDYAQLYPAMVGSQWYASVTEQEMKLFYQEWESWRRRSL